MTAEYFDQINELLDEAAYLEPGPTKVALLEEAVRLADTHGDLDYGFMTREQLIQACTFGGFPEKSLVAFSWCLAQSDRHPDQFPDRQLFWQLKWITNSLDQFAQISRAQIDAMLEDMRRRYERAGVGRRVAAQVACQLALRMGDLEEARRHWQVWQGTPRDWLSDCEACEVNSAVRCHFVFGDDEAGVRAARPILRGSLRCAEIPHATYNQLLLPLARLGRVEEAMEAHRKGIRLTNGKRQFVEEVGDHLKFLALTDNLSRAARLLQRHLPIALDLAEQRSRFHFLLAALFLLDRLQEKGQKTLRVNLPKTFPGYRETGSYPVPTLAAALADEARGLAERFDARNGTDWYGRMLAENADLRRWVCAHPCEPVRELDEA